jgi:glycosyltransferase involved in cell wall biosynthesis
LSEVIVIANGCTDNTVKILNRYIKDKKFKKLKVIEIYIGDKCNAWNEYIHNIAADEDVHFFTDADVQFTSNAFAKMAEKLLATPNASAIAGLPFSGRNIKQYRQRVIEQKLLFGNCYGLKKEFLELVKEKQFYLPAGLGLIDSAIMKVVKRDITDIDDPINERITFDINCGYLFSKLSIANWSDIKLYINRIARYKTGKFQQVHLEKISYLDWPRDLNQINEILLNQINNGEIKLNPLLKAKIACQLEKKLIIKLYATYLREEEKIIMIFTSIKILIPTVRVNNFV